MQPGSTPSNPIYITNQVGSPADAGFAERDAQVRVTRGRATLPALTQQHQVAVRDTCPQACCCRLEVLVGLRLHALWKVSRLLRTLLTPHPTCSACPGTWHDQPWHLAVLLGTAAPLNWGRPSDSSAAPPAQPHAQPVPPCRLSQCATLHCAATPQRLHCCSCYPSGPSCMGVFHVCRTSQCTMLPRSSAATSAAAY